MKSDKPVLGEVATSRAVRRVVDYTLIGLAAKWSSIRQKHFDLQLRHALQSSECDRIPWPSLRGGRAGLLPLFLIVISTQDRSVHQIRLSAGRERLDVIGLKVGPGQLASTLSADAFVRCVPEYPPLLRTEAAVCILALEDRFNESTDDVVALPTIDLCIGPFPDCLKVLAKQLFSGR